MCPHEAPRKGWGGILQNRSRRVRIHTKYLEGEDWLGLASEAGDYAKWQGAERPPSFSVSTAWPGRWQQPTALPSREQPPAVQLWDANGPLGMLNGAFLSQHRGK